MCLCNPVENAETKVRLLAGIRQQCVFQSKILPRNVPTTLQVVRSLSNIGISIYPHHIKPSQNKEIAIHYQMAAIDCCCLAIWRISPTLMTSNDKSQDNVFQMAKTFFSSYLQFVTSPHNITLFQLLLFMFTISILFSPSFSGVVFPSWWSANPQIKCSNISADDRFQFQDYKIYSLVDSCQLRVSHLPSERVLFQLESSISSIRMWIVQV